MQYRIQDTSPYAPGKLSYYQIILRHRQEYAENAILQMIFVHAHPDEFFESVERMILPKILDDIRLIMEKQWAVKLSSESLDAPRRHDFYHCHILSSIDLKLSGNEASMIDDMDKLTSSVSILYHTREHRDQEHTLPDHSILSSSLFSEPKPIDPKKVKSKKILSAVNHLDLGKNHIVQIDFQANPRGTYTVADGTKLNLRGILAFDPIKKREFCG